MSLINGRLIAEQKLNILKAEVQKLTFVPVLCDVLVGDDPVSRSYVNVKRKTAEKVGLEFRTMELPESSSQAEIVSVIQQCNGDPRVCGIIVQLPLPDTVNRQEVLDAIDPKLDVDCLGTENADKFYKETEGVVPPTAAAVLEILDSLPVRWSEGKIVIVGKGLLVGMPVARLLERRGIVFSAADRATEDLPGLLKSADVVISGTGQPGLITGSDIKEGSIVIDAGTAESGGGIVGDVDTESANTKASFVSPVPGGVGPVTVAMLLDNAVDQARRRV